MIYKRSLKENNGVSNLMSVAKFNLNCKKQRVIVMAQVILNRLIFFKLKELLLFFINDYMLTGLLI